jgi:hypothetical protein
MSRGIIPKSTTSSKLMDDETRTLRILFNKAIDDVSVQVADTKSQVDQAKADLAAAQAQVVSTQAQLTQAQADLSKAQTQIAQLNAKAAAATAGQFVYAPAPGTPVITSISPVTGSPTGGDTVTITGSGFTGVTAVSFGLTPAASFVFLNDTQITAVSPPGSGPVNVRITTPLGASTTPPLA